MVSGFCESTCKRLIKVAINLCKKYILYFRMLMVEGMFLIFRNLFSLGFYHIIMLLIKLVPYNHVINKVSSILVKNLIVFTIDTLVLGMIEKSFSNKLKSMIKL